MARTWLAVIAVAPALWFASFAVVADEIAKTTANDIEPCKTKTTADEELECLRGIRRNIDAQLYQPTDPKAAPDNLRQLLKSKEQADSRIAEVNQELNFAGFNWSLGVALTHLTGKKAVEEAQVVGGVVRVTKDYSEAVALMFETHYFFKMRTDSRQQTTGNGPFVAIRLADTEGNTVDAFGVGWMWGARRSAPKITSFNIGAGYFVDTKVKRLGSGVVEGEPLPAGETEIRYRETDASGWMFMLSSTF